jgi:hypothetical protein
VAAVFITKILGDVRFLAIKVVLKTLKDEPAGGVT